MPEERALEGAALCFYDCGEVQKALEYFLR
jgi:hypothetical protein